MGNCVAIQDQPNDRIYDPLQTWNFNDKLVFTINGLFCYKSFNDAHIPSDIASLIAKFIRVIDSYILNIVQQQIILRLVCNAYITYNTIITRHFVVYITL